TCWPFRADPTPEGPKRISIPLQHPADARKRLVERRLVMDDGETNILLAGVDASIRGAGGVAARKHADRGLAPQPQRGLLAVADIEPEEETAGRAVEAVASGKRRFGEVELAAIERPILDHMGFVAPQGRRSGLNRQRQLAAAEVSKPLELADI